MKQVLILRHADWDLTTDALTPDARVRTKEVKPSLPHFDKVLSSPFGRSTETAELLAGQEPTVDNRISFPTTTADIAAELSHRRKTHPLGIAGAIFDTPAAREPYRKQAELFLELVKETLAHLDDGETALIVSHDGIMVALDKLLHKASFDKADHTYAELAGFYLNSDMTQVPFP